MEESPRRRRPVVRFIPGSFEGPGIRTYIIASVSVFIACSAIAIWVWNGARQSERRNTRSGLAYSTTLVQEAVQNRLRAYEELTRGAGGLVYAEGDQLDQSTWSRYVKSLNLNTTYPGVRSVGYAPSITQAELPDFKAGLASTGVTNFTLDPAGDRNQYVPVTFVETNTPRSLIPGTDLWSESVRRTALEEARDTGKITLSGRVIPLTFKDDPRQAGFYVLYPVYRSGQPVGTVAERQAALQGYVFTFLRSSDLFEGLFKGLPVSSTDYALQFFDGPQPKAANLLYQSSTYDDLVKNKSTASVAQPLMIENRQWTIAVYLGRALQNSSQQLKPVSILAYGLAFSTLISASLLIIMISRARAITYDKQQEVQVAKDELLSLASHQLRTPATGVKQFVGMLLEGYAGKVTKEQRTMLQKAYRSNERQLEIINDILHVTRLDSGRMVLDKQRVELNELITTIIDEQRSHFTNRRQKITFRSSAKKIYIMADSQYLCMALDNLINNASKYSRPGQRISVRVQRHRQSISIYVVDHGVGIESTDMHKLFKKFSRIHNELSVEAGGSGIGLYLCQEIIRLHGGTIAVESTPKRGSTFIVELPRNEQA